MRITGGNLKGRPLISAKGSAIRPASDKVRQALFNIIGHDLAGSAVLDLFAGTGAYGLEAISRGAGRAIFIDNSSEALLIIKKNISQLGVSEQCQIKQQDLVAGDSFKTVEKDGSFDIVFIDPPYRLGFMDPVLKKVGYSGFLSSDGVVVAETSKEEYLPEKAGNLELWQVRKYGSTCLWFYLKQESAYDESENCDLPRIF
jgi:16S rRNA (guanine966-N2)-methyltransferase